MSSQDIRNNAAVHGILVRNYLNVRRLDSTVVGETVTIKGFLELTREAESVDASVRRAVALRTLDKVEEEIRKIPGINYVRWNLDNWIRVGRRWVQAELATSSKRKRWSPEKEEASDLVKRIKRKLLQREEARASRAPDSKRPSE